MQPQSKNLDPSKSSSDLTNNIVFNVKIDLANEVKFFQNFIDSKNHQSNTNNNNELFSSNHKEKKEIKFEKPQCINEKNELLPDKPFEKPYNSQNSSNPQKTSKTKDLVKFSKEKQSIFIDKPIERSFSSKKYQELPLSSNMKNSSKIVPIGGISQFLIDKFFRRLNLFSMIKRIPKNPENLFRVLDDKVNFQNEKKEFGEFEAFRHLIILLKFLKRFYENHDLIIHPFSNLKIFWDFLHFVLMLFVFFYLPLDIVFEIQASTNIRYVLSLFMLCDNCLGFSTAFFHHGKLISKRRSIVAAYFCFVFYN